MGSGCESAPPVDQGAALAAYEDQVLYQEEVAYFLPDSLSPADNARLTQQYIDEWIKGQVVKAAATNAVPDLREKVDFLLRAYERSVIEHEYASHLIETQGQALAVSDQEVQDYYEANQEKFRSQAYYYQYFYVETELAGQYKVMNLIRSEEPEKIQELIEWSRQNATEYKLDSSYVDESEIERISKGFHYGNIKKVSLGTPFAYGHDEDAMVHWDFFRLLDVIEPGDQLPLPMCRERIVQILRNQLKESLIQKHISSMVKQAKAANKVEIYE